MTGCTEEDCLHLGNLILCLEKLRLMPDLIVDLIVDVNYIDVALDMYTVHDFIICLDKLQLSNWSK